MEPKRDYHLWRRNWQIGGPEILQVPASGGIARRLTVANINSGESQHTFPVFLPDGQHFLYTIQSAKTGDGGVYLGSLRLPQVRNRLLKDVSNAEYAVAASGDRTSGYLLFARGGVLMVKRSTLSRLQLKGEAFSIDKLTPRAGIPGGIVFPFAQWSASH